MKTVKEVLANKGDDIWSVSPETSVYEALTTMSDRNIGALLVLDGERLAGVFSERDYARKVILVGKTSRETQVSEVMTADVISIRPELSIVETMALMTANHVRHLPVCVGDRPVGVVSIGDAVKAIIDDQEFTIDQLKGYIAGTNQSSIPRVG
jgi:CBS domain-containing protein